MKRAIDTDLGVCVEKQFSPLIQKDSAEMNELITQRAGDYMDTIKFGKFESAVIETIEEIREDQETKNMLLDRITALWTDAFAAGYKAGMVDVMAAMAFNKAGITAVKYPKEE